MKLSTIFEHLNYGEFSRIMEGDKVNGQIPEASYREVISFINLGVQELYARFGLSSKVLILSPVTDKTTYELIPANATSNGGTEILDDDEPYTIEMLSIVAVYDESGCELPLNNRNDTDSLFTPRHLVLQVPNPKTGNSIMVEYKATVPVMPVETTNLNTDIDLPEFLIKALLYFVGSRKHFNVMQLNGATQGRDYFSLFEEECRKISAYGLITSSDDHSFLSGDPGWS